MGSGFCWLLAWLLAVAPGALYLLGIALPWWVSVASFGPLVALIVRRAEGAGSSIQGDGAGPTWGP